MTQTRDLIKKMADFFKGEEFYEKGEDARLELSPDDVRCMNEIVKACGNAISRQAVLDEAFEVETKEYGRIEVVGVDAINSLLPVTPQQKYEDIAKAFQFGLAFGFGYKYDEMDRVIDEIKKVITPQPKTGHWIVELKENVTEYIVGTGCRVFICSECQEWQDKRSSYCPVCGLKMVEPKERGE